VTIQDGVEFINMRVFEGCSSLESITIPSSVTAIDVGTIPKNAVIYATSGSYAEQWAQENGYTVKIVGGASNQTSTDTTPTQDSQSASTDTNSTTPAPVGTVLNVPASKCKVKVLSANASNPTVSFIATTDKKAATVNIPDSVTVDGVTYKVTAVAAKALSGNKKVKTVTIGKNVTSIGKAAFKGCTKLKSVNVKSTVLTKIGAEAFSGDKSLTKLTLKTAKLTKKSVGKNALKGTNKKLVVKVPKKQVTTYKKYFKGKGSKTVTVKK
jgi:hypothetical protein